MKLQPDPVPEGGICRGCIFATMTARTQNNPSHNLIVRHYCTGGQQRILRPYRPKNCQNKLY